MKKFLLLLYRLVFLNRFMVPFNYGVYLVALRGIGILNYENKVISGERFLLKKLSRVKSNPVIFDVGANVGDYSKLCMETMPNARLFSFEPHPKTFIKLSTVASNHAFTAVNAALDKKTGKARLFDYATADGTSHASLYDSVITDFHQSQSTGVDTVTWTLDDFMKENGVEYIDLLKIDTEGNEYPVLQGASEALKNNRIGMVQFEFSELNIANRNFMKDFYDLLQGYEFFRLIPGYLHPLGSYKAARYEIYLFQNIVAVSKNQSFV